MVKLFKFYFDVKFARKYKISDNIMLKHIDNILFVNSDWDFENEIGIVVGLGLDTISLLFFICFS